MEMRFGRNNNFLIILGYGSMGISNSIGSNTFDILLCLGLPWFIKAAFSPIEKGHHWVGINSAGLEYSAISLLSTLLMLYIAFWLNKFRLDRRVGYACLIMYAVFLILASLIELNVFFPVNLPTCVRWVSCRKLWVVSIKRTVFICKSGAGWCPIRIDFLPYLLLVSHDTRVTNSVGGNHSAFFCWCCYCWYWYCWCNSNLDDAPLITVKSECVLIMKKTNKNTGRSKASAKKYIFQWTIERKVLKWTKY